MFAAPRRGIARLRESAAKRGIAGTASVIFGKGRARLVRLGRSSRELLFDLKHGVDTRGIVESIDGRDPKRYEIGAPSWIRRAIRLVEVDLSASTFLDLGCGKGVALLVAAEFPFRRIVGVEMTHSLVEAARANAARAARPVEIVEDDAARYHFPCEPLVVYLYNPFGPETLSMVVANLEATLREQPRDLHIVYVQPEHRDVVDASKAFAPIHERSRFVIYAARST